MKAKLVPINPQRPSVLFLLQQVLEQAEDIKALMIVGVTHDGSPLTSRSEMSTSTLCYLLKTLELEVNDVVREE